MVGAMEKLAKQRSLSNDKCACHVSIRCARGMLIYALRTNVQGGLKLCMCWLR